MGHEREIAGIVTGAGAIALILMDHIPEGSIILASMMAFFIGEKNGQRKNETE